MVFSVVVVVFVRVLVFVACSSGSSFVIVVATAIEDERITKNVLSAIYNSLIKLGDLIQIAYL